MTSPLEPAAHYSFRPSMDSFVKLPRDAHSAMAQRNVLMAQPASYFSQFFNGRIPSLPEQLAWIEQKVLQSISWDFYRNDTYFVMVERADPFIHICIRRHDGDECKNWKHHQQIKSELIGPECEAVELFPAESRLIDTTNEYHLWVNPNPGYRFPFGFSWNRFVTDKPLTLEGAHHAA